MSYAENGTLLFFKLTLQILIMHMVLYMIISVIYTRIVAVCKQVYIEGKQ